MAIASHKLQRGFTLIELLVAMAVFALMGVIMLQVVGNVSDTIARSDRTMGASEVARVVFSRMARDIDALINRADIDANFTSNPAAGSTHMEFFSMVLSPDSTNSGISAANANRRISCITYRLAPSNSPLGKDDSGKGRLELQRGTRAIGVNDSFMGLTSPTSAPVSIASNLPDPASYDPVGTGVIRMLVGFQLREQVGGKAPGSIVFTVPTRAGTIDLSKVGALVVLLAVVDPSVFPILNADAVEKLSDEFNVIPTSKNPISDWIAITEKPDDMNPSIPFRARASVRAFQRVFPLPPPQQ